MHHHYFDINSFGGAEINSGRADPLIAPPPPPPPRGYDPALGGQDRRNKYIFISRPALSKLHYRGHALLNVTVKGATT